MEVLVFAGASHMAGSGWPAEAGLASASSWRAVEAACPWLLREEAGA
jgi:hypothetical protein